MKKYLKTITFVSLMTVSTSLFINGETLTINGVGTFSEIISKEEINNRVMELGAQIDRDYAEIEDSIVFIGILNGCLPFLSDLMRNVKHLSKMETVRVSSYHGTLQSSGTIQLKYDSIKENSLQGKHIIIVDDIVDTGLTMQWLIEHFTKKSPASIRIASLILKEGCQSSQTPNIDYVGFISSPKFLIGCGLDYNEEYRNLPGIWALTS
ncbi:hypoxanthine phosphoribosyltransferase [Candidatus Dependentiae bacterium]|nr:hypoxanthine phosphoribosyltransferase [Candidatus Dependentiae bacterium]